MNQAPKRKKGKKKKAMKPSIDFNMFLNKVIIDSDKCETNECKSIQRTIAGLVYYDKLNNIKKKNAQTIFSQFLLDIYKHYLDDITHLMTIHNNDLQVVNELLLQKLQYIPCNVNNCILSGRYCEININVDTTEMDLLSAFHEQTWDNVHFYVMHLFDLGLRQKKEEEKESKEEQKANDDSDIIENKWQCFDKAFKVQRMLLKSKRKKYARFAGRFKDISNKFIIQTITNTKQNKDPAVEETFLDKLYERIVCNEDIKAKQVNELNYYLVNEEFDTDSIVEDINEVKPPNILQSITDNQLCDSICGYVKQNKLKGTVFSTGFTFFYWRHFGAKDERRRIQNPSNRNDYGGYSPFELYIEKSKYLNLKVEILTNKNNEVGIGQYNSIVVKAKQYMCTQTVKKMKASSSQYDDTINFEIQRDEPIAMSHIKSLLFYTDCSILSTSFRKTFHRLDFDESLESVKERNSYYWWMSKYIIEVVNCYGINGTRSKYNGSEAGPFYCGMRSAAHVPGFRIRLCGPISSTKEMFIAQNVEDDGIILELDNQRDIWTKTLRLFNVSFLSKHKEENEAIFVHGQYSIEISSVRLTATWQNYGLFFKALSQFDAAISGGSVQDFNSKDGTIIRLLCAKDKSVPVYIEDTFKMFAYHKKTFNINLNYVITDYPSVLQDLIVGSSYDGGNDKNNISYSDITNDQNLIKKELVNLFPNLNHITVECTDSYGECSYQFSLCQLLEILNENRSNKIKCSLYGVWKDCNRSRGGDSRSWLYYVYASIASKLNGKYKQTEISLQQTRDSYGSRKDLLHFECV